MNQTCSLSEIARSLSRLVECSLEIGLLGFARALQSGCQVMHHLRRFERFDQVVRSHSSGDSGSAATLQLQAFLQFIVKLL
jgi:hypothetical protein